MFFLSSFLILPLWWCSDCWQICSWWGMEQKWLTLIKLHWYLFLQAYICSYVKDTLFSPQSSTVSGRVQKSSQKNSVSLHCYRPPPWKCIFTGCFFNWWFWMAQKTYLKKAQWMAKKNRATFLNVTFFWNTSLKYPNSSYPTVETVQILLQCKFVLSLKLLGMNSLGNQFRYL